MRGPLTRRERIERDKRNGRIWLLAWIACILLGFSFVCAFIPYSLRLPAMPRYRITSQKECRRIFNAEVKPAIVAQYGRDDRVALDEAWNDWTDMLCKDRVITESAYNNWTRN